MFHFLVDELPESLLLSSGKVYDIKTDYRVVLKIARLISDESFFLNDLEKMQLVVKVFYKDEVSLEDLKEAYEAIFSYIDCFQDVEKSKGAKSKALDIFDYEVDSASIYACFMQLYGIDLIAEKMHWFKFYALLTNINDGTPQLVYTMQLRGLTEADIKNLTPEEKAKIRKKKSEVELHRKTQATPEERSANIFSSFPISKKED